MTTTPQPDLAKVKAAVQKYIPGRINIKPVSGPKAPVDSSHRKIVKSLGDSCKGFSHFA